MDVFQYNVQILNVGIFANFDLQFSCSLHLIAFKLWVKTKGDAPMDYMITMKLCTKEFMD